ncbi:MAG TPA: hypothetical protein VNZ03_22980 [Terriglobales bacterium]|nr:hypothetical protein [Terriglobales bacterium]
MPRNEWKRSHRESSETAFVKQSMLEIRINVEREDLLMCHKGVLEQQKLN